MRLSLEVFGEDVINRDLLRFAERAVDARPVWRALATRFEEGEKRQFASEGRWGSGAKWAKLADSTVRQKIAGGFPLQILRRTERLRDSLIGVTGDTVRVFHPDRMELGSRVEYGRYHTTGTKRMPRRRPVQLPEREKREWVKILQRFVVTGRLPA